MSTEEQAAPVSAEPTAEADIQVVNKLEPEQLWLYALAQSVPLGTRIVVDERVRERLAIASDVAGCISRLLVYCVNQIVRRNFTPASTLLAITLAGLEPERATLLVDVATTAAAHWRDAASERVENSLQALSERLETLESRRRKRASDVPASDPK